MTRECGVLGSRGSRVSGKYKDWMQGIHSSSYTFIPVFLIHSVLTQRRSRESLLSVLCQLLRMEKMIKTSLSLKRLGMVGADKQENKAL